MNRTTTAGFTRRQFAAAMSAAGLLKAQTSARPNVLWITCEDIGPHIGPYGDTYADTPNLDRFATQATLYRNAWSNAPVCAPARTTIISGIYPPSTGAEHMRSMTTLPASMKMFPCYLREAGYYTSNNVKEDYNLKHTGTVWDDSSRKAHWRNRGAGQPFFSVFNFEITHESQIRRRPHTLMHDPSKVRIPAYHPDTPEVRHDWAQYYDNITTMDRQAGEVLAALEKDGLADDTVVFFYGDHGSGMPRNKRWPYDSGLHVPLLVRIPEKFRSLATADAKAGGPSDRLVSFVDLAPTVLSLAGVPAPGHFQGHAFLGRHAAPEQPYVYGFRGRMDERLDMVRSVRDKRYVYIRNYMPHKIYGQHLQYMFDTPTTTVWKKLYDEHKLNAVQSRFWQTKPPEELYDLEQDRDEINNLASSPQHKAVMKRLRKAQQKLAVDIRDVGFLPEAEMHARAAGGAPYDLGHEESRYPMKDVMHAAETAASAAPAKSLDGMLAARESAVRYWAVLGLQMRGADAVKQYAPQLRKALDDSSPIVRVAAAEALGRYGAEEDSAKALERLLALAPADRNGIHISIAALNAIGAMGPRARSARESLKGIIIADPKADQRFSTYTPRLIEDALVDLQ